MSDDVNREQPEHDGDLMPPSFPPSPNVQRGGAAGASGGNGLRGSGESHTAGDAADERINQLEENKTEPQKSRLARFVSGVIETVVVVGVALVLAVLIKTFLVQPFEIPSESMADTLKPGDRILVNKLADTESELHRGDVVVFVDPGDWLAGTSGYESSGVRAAFEKLGRGIGLLPQNAGNHLVKRIIGKPGDRVSCAGPGAKILVNGVEVDEPYLKPGVLPSETAFDVVVPAGHLWVMGDNRSNSQDSRYHQQVTGFGFVPIENVEGRAWLRLYPFTRVKSLGGVGPEAFSKVPDPTQDAAPAK